MPERKVRIVINAISDSQIKKHDRKKLEVISTSEAYLTFELNNYPHIDLKALDMYETKAKAGAYQDEGQVFSKKIKSDFVNHEFDRKTETERVRNIYITSGFKTLTVDCINGEDGGGGPLKSFQDYIYNRGWRAIQEPDPRHVSTHLIDLGNLHAHYCKIDNSIITCSEMSGFIDTMAGYGLFDESIHTRTEVKRYDRAEKDLKKLAEKRITKKYLTGTEDEVKLILKKERKVHALHHNQMAKAMFERRKYAEIPEILERKEHRSKVAAAVKDTFKDLPAT